jgi:hypothetical protein
MGGIWKLTRAARSSSASLGRGEVRARATAIGPWENWYTASDPCDGCYTYFYNGAKRTVRLG